jgi:hypothetical protein
MRIIAAEDESNERVTSAKIYGHVTYTDIISRQIFTSGI